MKTAKQRRLALANLTQLLAYIHGCGGCLRCHRRAEMTFQIVADESQTPAG